MKTSDADHHVLPAPTVWPMVLALGTTLAGAALVTHVAVGIVGLALMVIAGIGWWREVLPEEQMEHVPLRPPIARAAPILPVAARVDRLHPGEDGHRVRLPTEVQPISAGIKGGLVGGAAMAIIGSAYGLIFQGSVWYPINLLASVAMPALGRADLAQVRAFSMSAFVLGVIVHVIVSVLVGLLYAVILPMLPRRHMVWGGLIAPLLWTGLLWAVSGVMNPVLNARVDWPWFVVSQIAFGITAGIVVSRAQPIATMQTWPLHMRAGLHVATRNDRRPKR